MRPDFKIIWRRARVEQKGQILILTLIMMVFGSVTILSLLTLMGTGLKATRVFDNKSATLYASDAGIEDAMWHIKYGQLEGKFASYDPHDYSTTWTYSLPQVNGQPAVNNKGVNVTIHNEWISTYPATAPDKTTANSVINNTRLMVTGGPYGTSSYNIVLTFTPQTSDYDAQGNLKLTVTRIGIWLPPGFTYSGNNNLGSPPSTSQQHEGGWAYDWILNSVFTSLPGAVSTDSPIVAKIHFDYGQTNVATTTLTSGSSSGAASLIVASTSGFPTSGSLNLPGETAAVQYSGITPTSFTGIPSSGSGSLSVNHSSGAAVTLHNEPEAVSWVNTDSSKVPDLSYTWDDTTRVFHITSSSENTTIDSYVAKSQLRKIGGVLDGDYYATGNSLMRDTNGDGVKESKTDSSAVVAAPNPSGADNGVPGDANISASFLYWGTWYISDYWGDIQQVSRGGRCTTLFTDNCSKFYSSLVLNYSSSNFGSMTTGANDQLNGVWGSSSSNIYAVGLNGAILRYNGTSWSSVTSGTTSQLNDVWGSGSNDVYSVGYNGTILHYNGTSWNYNTSGIINQLNGIWGSANNDVFAVGDNGTILRYNGTSWSSMTSGTGNHLKAVWGNASNNVIAVGQNGTILRYNGTSWSSMTSGTTNYLNSVWGSSSNNVIAVGLNGAILRYNGASWSSMASGTHIQLNAVWGSSSSNVYAVGLNGAILRYNGTSWSFQNGNGQLLNGTGQLYGIWGSSSSNILVVGIGNFDNGSDWSVNSNTFRANGNNDGDISINRDLTQYSNFAFDLGTYPSPDWVFTLSWEQWYSGTTPGTGDGLDISLSNDGGTTWSNRIQTFRGSDVGNSGTSVFSCYQFNLPVAYLTSNFKIKFHVVGFNISGQYVNVDDIRLNALNPNTGMTFKINNGSGAKVVYFDVDGNPAWSNDPANKVISSRTQAILTYSFAGSNPVFTGFAEACYRDVTALVHSYAEQPVSPATNYNGHATYSAVGDLGDTGSDTSAYQLAHAGWSLVTVYTGPETLGHQLYLFDNFFGSGNQSSGGIHIVWNGDADSGGIIKGFVVPQQIAGETNAAKVTCFVTEGDNQLAGDYLAINGTRLWDGTNSTNNSKSSPNNVWNSKSYLSGGYSIYDGVDIDTLGLDPTASPPQYVTWQSQILKPGDTSATIDLYTQQDYWFMVYLIISFRSDVTTGGSMNYLIRG